MNLTLHYLFLSYLILYAIFGVGLFVLDALVVSKDEKKDERQWETPLDIVLSVIGFVGMLFLFFNFQPQWLQLAWRPVSVGLLVI